jgi:hypothetical protein
MSRRNRIVCDLVAIGVPTAAVALLTGLSAARADELSDVRANQQQIQQRLDQLSQPPELNSALGALGDGAFSARAASDQPPVIGGSFPRSFLIPGTNTSVTISGSVQQNFGYGVSR